MAGSFGDYVSYDLRASHGGTIGYAYVIGEMNYSEGGSHICLAGEKELGMPIHEAHCSVISSGHNDLCRSYRTRWHEKFTEQYGWRFKDEQEGDPTP